MRTFFIAAIIATSTGIISCNNSSNNSISNSTSSKKDSATTVKGKTVGQKEFYVCPMDTDVISNHSDSCPKCGMDLEKKILPDTTKVTVK